MTMFDQVPPRLSIATPLSINTTQIRALALAENHGARVEPTPGNSGGEATADTARPGDQHNRYKFGVLGDCSKNTPEPYCRSYADLRMYHNVTRNRGA